MFFFFFSKFDSMQFKGGNNTFSFTSTAIAGDSNSLCVSGQTARKEQEIRTKLATKPQY